MSFLTNNFVTTPVRLIIYYSAYCISHDVVSPIFELIIAADVLVDQTYCQLHITQKYKISDNIAMGEDTPLTALKPSITKSSSPKIYMLLQSPT